MLTGALFTRIETEYPKAFKALAEIYRKSRANVNYYRFLICHRFIRCNFGRLDNRQDIDGMGRFTFEDVELSDQRRMQVCRHYMQPRVRYPIDRAAEGSDETLYGGMGDEEIADMLFTYRPRRCANEARRLP